MPVGKSSSDVPAPFDLTASLTLMGTMVHVQHVEACPDMGPVCATQPQQPYQHDQHLYSSDLVLDDELGLVRHLGFEAVVTLRQTTDRIRFLDLEGRPYVPPVPDYHHRNETLVGPTDPWLMLHTSAAWAGFTWAAKGGVTVPLGSTVSNPFVLGRQGLAHEHIQFGTGTWDPLVGLSVDRRFGAVTASLWTLSRFTVGTNGHGYRSGDKLLAGATATSGLGLQRWTFSAGLDAYRETPERWGGIIEQEGNLGRTDFILDVSAAWSFSLRWVLKLGAKVPVHTVAQGEQATYPAIITLGLATDFHLAGR